MSEAADTVAIMWGLSDQVWVGILSAAALIVAAVFQAPRYFRDGRAGLLREIEILNALPSDSTSRGLLLAHVDSQVETLSGNGAKRRSASGIILGLIFLVPSAYFTWQLFIADSGWWWLTSPLIFVGWLIGVVGTAQGAKKHHRTPTGRIIDPKKEKETS